MSLALIVYLAGIVKGVCLLLALSGVCGLCIYVLWLANYSMEYPIDKSTTTPPKSLLTTSAVLLTLLALIPNKETLYTMVAAHTVQDIATSPKVQELGGKSLEVIEKVMDDYLKEVKPAKVEGEK